LTTVTKDSRVSSTSGDDESKRPGPIARVGRMLSAVQSEIRKVTWPSPGETRNLTIVVIMISVFVGGLLGLVDLILAALVQQLPSIGGF